MKGFQILFVQKNTSIAVDSRTPSEVDIKLAYRDVCGRVRGLGGPKDVVGGRVPEAVTGVAGVLAIVCHPDGADLEAGGPLHQPVHQLARD